VIACSGHKASYADPSDDVLTYAVGSAPARRGGQRQLRGLDVTRALVAIGGRSVCANVTLAGPPQIPSTLTLSFRGTTSLACCISFSVELVAGGRVRYGEPASAYGFDRHIRRLVPIDGGRVAIAGRTISLAGRLPPPAKLGSAFAADAIGWMVVTNSADGRGGPSFGDWVPGYSGSGELVVRERDGRVMKPTG
jgi:hypothetical protein